MQLVEASAEYRKQFLEMAREFHHAGDDRYDEALEDFDAHIEELHRFKTTPPEGLVPGTKFWLVSEEGRMLGISGLRHHLTPALENEGGHISYSIRPSERNKGYGTRILALTLDRARDLGLTEALVTCDADNIASARVIVKNGGKLKSRGVSERTGKEVLRYTIAL